MSQSNELVCDVCEYLHVNVPEGVDHTSYHPQWVSNRPSTYGLGGADAPLKRMHHFTHGSLGSESPLPPQPILRPMDTIPATENERKHLSSQTSASLECPLPLHLPPPQFSPIHVEARTGVTRERPNVLTRQIIPPKTESSNSLVGIVGAFKSDSDDSTAKKISTALHPKRKIAVPHRRSRANAVVHPLLPTVPAQFVLETQEQTPASSSNLGVSHPDRADSPFQDFGRRIVVARRRLDLLPDSPTPYHYTRNPAWVTSTWSDILANYQTDRAIPDTKSSLVTISARSASNLEEQSAPSGHVSEKSTRQEAAREKADFPIQSHGDFSIVAVTEQAPTQELPAPCTKPSRPPSELELQNEVTAAKKQITAHKRQTSFQESPASPRKARHLPSGLQLEFNSKDEYKNWLGFVSDHTPSLIPRGGERSETARRARNGSFYMSALHAAWEASTREFENNSERESESEYDSDSDIGNNPDHDNEYQSMFEKEGEQKLQQESPKKEHVSRTIVAHSPVHFSSFQSLYRAPRERREREAELARVKSKVEAAPRRTNRDVSSDFDSFYDDSRVFLSDSRKRTRESETGSKVPLNHDEFISAFPPIEEVERQQDELMMLTVTMKVSERQTHHSNCEWRQEALESTRVSYNSENVATTKENPETQPILQDSKLNRLNYASSEHNEAPINTGPQHNWEDRSWGKAAENLRPSAEERARTSLDRLRLATAKLKKQVTLKCESLELCLACNKPRAPDSKPPKELLAIEGFAEESIASIKKMKDEADLACSKKRLEATGSGENHNRVQDILNSVESVLAAWPETDGTYPPPILDLTRLNLPEERYISRNSYMYRPSEAEMSYYLNGEMPNSSNRPSGTKAVAEPSQEQMKARKDMQPQRDSRDASWDKLLKGNSDRPSEKPPTTPSSSKFNQCKRDTSTVCGLSPSDIEELVRYANTERADLKATGSQGGRIYRPSRSPLSQSTFPPALDPESTPPSNNDDSDFDSSSSSSDSDSGSDSEPTTITHSYYPRKRCELKGRFAPENPITRGRRLIAQDEAKAREEALNWVADAVRSGRLLDFKGLREGYRRVRIGVSPTRESVDRNDREFQGRDFVRRQSERIEVDRRQIEVGVKEVDETVDKSLVEQTQENEDERREEAVFEDVDLNDADDEAENDSEDEEVIDSCESHSDEWSVVESEGESDPESNRAFVGPAEEEFELL